MVQPWGQTYLPLDGSLQDIAIICIPNLVCIFRMGLPISPKEGKKYNHLFKNVHIPSFIILCCCHPYLTKSSSQHLFPKCKQPERRKFAVLQPRSWIKAFMTDTVRHSVNTCCVRSK